MTPQENAPTVLIVAVNPLSTTSNNGKTLASLFEGYPRQSIAQLYFHREIPTSDVCDNYYRISDEDLVRGIVRGAAPKGSKVLATDVATRVIPERTNNLLKKSRAIRFARSLLWKAVSLERGAVREWLDELNPDVIFFCGGDANHLYKKVLGLSKRYGAKIVYYITDDYVLPICTANVFHLITRAWTRRVFKQMCRESSLILTIGKKMSRVYESRYDIRSESVMNLVHIEDVEHDGARPTSQPMVFSYVGGLHSNRWRVLADLAEALERVWARGLHGELRIYSEHPPEATQLKVLDRPPFSAYCGGLDSEGVRTVLRESDVLVHVEASDRKSKRVTSLSISTKISEYMAAGKPILAIGPKDVASIEYLEQTSSAFLVAPTSAEAIDSTLAEIMSDHGQRQRRARRARATARASHDEKVVRPQFQQRIVALGRSPRAKESGGSP